MKRQGKSNKKASKPCGPSNTHSPLREGAPVWNNILEAVSPKKDPLYSVSSLGEHVTGPVS